MNVIDNREVDKLNYLHLNIMDAFIWDGKVCVKISDSMAYQFDSVIKRWQKLEIVDVDMLVDGIDATLIIDNYTGCQKFSSSSTIAMGRNSIGY